MKLFSHLVIASLALTLGTGLSSCAPPSDTSSISTTSAISASTPTPPEAGSITPNIAEMATGHQDYVAVALDSLPKGVEQVGTDPEAIALQMFGPTEPVEGFFEQTVQSEQVNDQTIVTLTQTGLPDDSIRGMRYRLEFEPTNAGIWKLQWVGKQYTCQPGRGSQEWTTEWCS